ncbi:MAG: Helix-turn-helix domain protein [Betaproteobacteria bacterium ADurb.Bin341]|nr:MAG: Helix-turn-helix domain protein [Betaproteobacteria bacterium ADurb.Bin341]
MDALRWHARPTPPLRPFIDRYWGWEGVACLPQCVLPGTGAECLFHYAKPFVLNREAAPQAALLSPRAHPVAIAASGRIGFVAVRFRSGRLRHLCARPLADLHDQAWPVEAIWGDAAARLTDELGACGGNTARIAALNVFFLKQLARHEESCSGAFDKLLDQLYYAPGTAVEQLTAQSGWTRRHFLRKFSKYYGLNPKRFARLARLNHTMRLLALDPGATALDAALRMGYYDQAHFIHETRALTSETPQTILGWLRGKSHFYNPPSRPIA